MTTLIRKNKAEKVVEKIESASFANRFINELNYYGKLDHASVLTDREQQTRSQITIPLDEMNVLEADAAESFNEYLDQNFERVWENILADEAMEKVHRTLEKLPEDRRNVQLYLTNYCPEFFRGESLGLVVCY